MQLTRKLQGPVFEKVAARYLLSDNPATYSSELIAHLYKQHPYLGQYQVNISIQGQDPSMGYLYGVFMISQASDEPPPDPQIQMGQAISQGQAPAPPEQTARIPIIVENKRTYSYDVFITPDGSFMPLNESRLASVLFNASPFSTAPALKGADAMQVASAGAENIAPDQPASSMGGGGSGGMPTKMASVMQGLISEEQVNSFLHKIAGSRELVDAVELNDAFKKAISTLTKVATQAGKVPVEETSLDDFDAAVVTKESGGYLIKYASGENYKVSEHRLSNVEGQEIPREVRQEILEKGSALLVNPENPGLSAPGNTTGLSIVDSTGIYAVMTKSGSPQRAAVVSGLISLDGRKTDLNLVVGKPGAAVQEKVAGVRCGPLDLTSVVGAEPRGEGVFLLKAAGVVTEPVDILHRVEDSSGISYMYDHALRGRGLIKRAAVKTVVADGNNVLIPEDSVFIPISTGKQYASDPASVDKIASRGDLINSVHLVSDGAGYSFSGAPLEPIFGKTSAVVDHSEALILLGVLGDTAEGAKEKLASAGAGKDLSFVPVRKAFVKEAEKAQIDENVIRIANVINIDLTKEAAALQSTDTVDSVLSLNFITPENIQGYLNALPVFEEASSSLAELLVGVRLGLSDVPEPAVSSALGGLERAIQGLKKLQIRSNAPM